MSVLDRNIQAIVLRLGMPAFANNATLISYAGCTVSANFQGFTTPSPALPVTPAVVGEPEL